MTSPGEESRGMRWASASRRAVSARGFTLVELVMVIVILGVLAVVALPRLTNSSDVAARGLHDSTLAYLRYAQKAAIAKRRTVCATFSGNTLSLTMATAAASFSCSAQLTGPRGDTPAQLSASSGASYAGSPAGLRFDGLGQPVDSAGALAASQTMQVSGLPNTITVEAVTGYVHD